MHEWALAEAILTTAAQIAEMEQLREVTQVTIRLGELQNAELGTLKFAINEIKSDLFKNAKFRFFRAKAELKCRVCGNCWQFKKEKLDDVTIEAIHFVPEVAHTFIKCPKCGSPDFEIVSGRGIWFDSIQGVK
ncbi:MAG: hydrogenase nickel incorporation protein HypA [Nitrososphaerota archaeon]|jgi:hydrogenase nickel incorporation protein HypA/HybF|nr:hydrogenase nickel incorporation protein HypA [Nitrososphaerota archaeon]